MTDYTIEVYRYSSGKKYLLVDLDRNQVLIQTSLRSIAVKELQRIHTAAKQQSQSE